MLNGMTSASHAQMVDGAKNASDCVYSVALAAGVARRVTVAAGAKLVEVSAPADVFIRWHASADAIVPVADDLTGNTAERNPFTTTWLRGLASFSIISPTAQVITLAWWN